MKRVINGKIELNELITVKDYTILHRISDNSYIVAYIIHHEDGNKVYWEQGHYDFTSLDKAIHFMNEKNK